MARASVLNAQAKGGVSSMCHQEEAKKKAQDMLERLLAGLGAPWNPTIRARGSVWHERSRHLCYDCCHHMGPYKQMKMISFHAHDIRKNFGLPYYEDPTYHVEWCNGKPSQPHCTVSSEVAPCEADIVKWQVDFSLIFIITS